MKNRGVGVVLDPPAHSGEAYQKEPHQTLHNTYKKHNNVNPKFNLNDWFADKFHGSETVMYVSSTNCDVRQHLPALVLIIGPLVVHRLYCICMEAMLASISWHAVA
jgi:hypothetical protein